MNDLIEFLEARLDEDDTYARSMLVETMHLRAGHPASADRQLLDIGAKRAVIELHAPVILHAGHPLVGPGPGAWRRVCRSCEPLRNSQDQAWPCPTLLALASVYRDHPDWREEWAA